MKNGISISVEHGHGLYPGSVVRWNHAKSEDRSRDAYRKVTAVDKAKATITIRELTTFEWPYRKNCDIIGSIRHSLRSRIRRSYLHHEPTKQPKSCQTGSQAIKG